MKSGGGDCQGYKHPKVQHSTIGAKCKGEDHSQQEYIPIAQSVPILESLCDLIESWKIQFDDAQHEDPNEEQ